MRRLARPALALGTLCLTAAVVDIALDVSLRRCWLPVQLRASIHGQSEYMRRLENWLFTREPNLDASYSVDRERHGDIVAKGQVEAIVDSGDGSETVVLRTDRYGFRNDVDRATCDVIVLGDSFTEGANVRDPWPLLLDRERTDAVCNLSVAGAGTLQQVEFLERFGLRRAPSVVVLGFFEGNDLEDNVNYDAMREQRAGETPLGRFIRGRPLPRLVRSAFRHAGEPGGSRPGSLVEAPIGGFRLAFHDPYVKRLGRTREGLESLPSWQLTRSLLDRAAELTTSAGARFVLVYLPSKAHVHLDVDANDLRELVREWAAGRGIGFVDTLPPLVEAARGGIKPFLTYDTHPSPAGHRVIAATVGEAI